jgi:hypothetical protein
VPENQRFVEVYDKSSLVNGIDCERCHGPATNHVNYHTAYPDVKEAKYVVTSRSLTKQQRLDACAVCHSGNDLKKEISTFKFKLGDTLASYFSPYARRDNTSKEFDVHGNQYNLMAQSKCYLGSKTLTCSTCHDPHTNASTELNDYSKKCISCHQVVNHSSLKTGKETSNTINTNCIDCHMPKKSSRAITFQLSGSNANSMYLLRTHKIAIYSGKNRTSTLHKRNNKASL